MKPFCRDNENDQAITSSNNNNLLQINVSRPIGILNVLYSNRYSWGIFASWQVRSFCDVPVRENPRSTYFKPSTGTATIILISKRLFLSSIEGAFIFPGLLLTFIFYRNARNTN